MSTQVATELEQHVVGLINAERAAAGLPALKIEAHLNDSAQAHSDWMAETGNFSHTGEDGSRAHDRIEETGLPLSGDDVRTSENIAFTSVSGSPDAGETDFMHDKLMESAGHRAAILDPDVTYVGVGLAVGHADGVAGDVLFMTQNFAHTDGQALVQDEIDGQTVLQPHVNGEPVGDPQFVGTPPPGENPDDDDDEEEDESGSSGTCFVATAAYGSRSHPDVKALRRFRDVILVKHEAGRSLIRAYWIVGPKLARLVSPAGVSGRAARAVIAPLARLAGAWADRRR